MIDEFLQDLREKIDDIRKSEIGKKIAELKNYFTYLGRYGSNNELLSELAFCILAANFNAEKSFEIQKELSEILPIVSEDELIRILRKKKHRYPETRAKYIVNARSKINEIVAVIRSPYSTKSIRNWLVENILGVGMKVASHFLRNTGRFDVAIIDFHILNFLNKNNIISKPKTLTLSKYLEIEHHIVKISENIGMEPGILDLYLWYLETGKIVK